MSDPSEDAITNFVSFTSTTREQAISFLKANNLDSQRAINAYFEDPTGPQPNTSNWESERNLAPLGYTTPEDGTRLTATAPPSRPPSRVNTYNPLPRESSTTEDTSKTPETEQKLSLAEREEKELQQAVALSLDQGFASQETGVTMAVPASGAQFGKATREHYDRDDWAMTIFQETAEEVVNSPDPEYRKRIEGQPAFIRPSAANLYLGGLITILHAIPLAREALLMRKESIPNYGKESQWWNGKPVRMPMIVTRGNEDDADWKEPIFECQRLMAFLDRTDRAFGSIDALANMKAMLNNSSDSDEAVSRFMEVWNTAAIRADPDNLNAVLFRSQAYKKSPFEMEDDEPVSKELFVFEPSVEKIEGQTLYDVLDNAIWGDQPGQDLDEVWLENVGEVLVMKLDSPDKLNPVDVTIPAVFYPDRYMSDCQDRSRELRVKKLEAQVHLKKIQEKIFHWETPPDYDGTMTRVQLLEASAALIPRSLRRALAGESSRISPEVARERVERMPRQLRNIAASIQRKLTDLAAQKEQVEQTLHACSKTMTEPSDSPREPPTHKYTLRGVCTEPHINYVLRYRPWEDESETICDDDSTSAAQWWRISFSAEDGRIAQAERNAERGDSAGSQNGDVVGYTIRKVQESEVLQAARKESSAVLLVYASEAATGTVTPYPPSLADMATSVSPELSKFIYHDNQAFAAELGQSQAFGSEGQIPEDPPAYSATGQPNSQLIEQKGKQTAKNDDGSDTEMADSAFERSNNLANDEHDDSDQKPGFEKDNNSDEEQNGGREMQEKSGSSLLAQQPA